MKHPFALGAALLIAAWTIYRWRGSSRERRAVGLLLAAGLGVYAADAIHFPDFEQLIEDLGSTLGRWTYLLVGGLAFLETGAFVGLVVPGESAIVLGGVIAGQGEINVVVLLGIVWACAVAGDSASFWLGRRLGRDFLLRVGPRFKITEERLEQVERFYAKHGGKTVLIGRFVGLVRAVSPFVAGSSRMPFGRFLPYDILGAGLWASAFVLLGYIFWHSFDTVADYAHKGAFALGSLIAVVVGGIWLVRTLENAERRAALDATIREFEQRRVAGPPIRALRAFGSGVLVPAWRRVSGPLRFLWRRVTPGQLGLELTTLLAIAAVGAFTFFGNASLVQGGEYATFDLDSLDMGDDLRGDWLVDLAKAVSFVGSGGYVLFVVGAVSGYLLVRRHTTEGLAVLSASVLTYAAVHIAKDAIDRPRPEDPLVETAGSSFPSAHAAYSVAFVACAVALRHALPGMASRTAFVLVAVVGAAAIGLSRVYLRAHYLSDVLAGWGLGAAIFAACGMAALVIAFLRHNGARS